VKARISEDLIILLGKKLPEGLNMAMAGLKIEKRH